MTALASPRSDADALTLARALEMVREARRSSSWFWMYAIQQGDDGAIKVGQSINPAERLYKLQQANPVTLRGLAAWRGFGDEEKLTHRMFAHLRTRGEWFRPDDELVRYVRLMGADFCDWDRK